jgi:hypothetical protein
MAENEITTKLLTLLNVSATKSKRRRPILPTTSPRKKLNKRTSIQLQTEEDNEKIAPEVSERDDKHESHVSAPQPADDDEDMREITAAGMFLYVYNATFH